MLYDLGNGISGWPAYPSATSYIYEAEHLQSLMCGYKAGIIFHIVGPAHRALVDGQSGAACRAGAMPLCGFVRPCVSALGARDNALFCPTPVMGDASVGGPL